MSRGSLEDLVRRSRPEEIMDLQHCADLRQTLRDCSREPMFDPTFAQPWPLRAYLIAATLALLAFGALQLVPHPPAPSGHSSPLVQSVESLLRVMQGQ